MQNSEQDEMQISFNDLTLNETDCFYDKVSKLVNPSNVLEEWMVTSFVAVAKDENESIGEMQFWRNKEAILINYENGFQDSESTIPIDLLYLYNYLKERGWDLVIEEEVISMREELWRKFFSVIEEEEKVEIKELENESGEIPNNDDEEDKEILPPIENKKEYRKPTANRYKIKDFKNHRYDFENREKQEKNHIF